MWADVEAHYSRAAQLYAEEGRPSAAAEAAARGARALEERQPEVGEGAGRRLGQPLHAPYPRPFHSLAAGVTLSHILSLCFSHSYTHSHTHTLTHIHTWVQMSQEMYRKAVEWLEDAGKDAMAGDIFRCRPAQPRHRLCIGWPAGTSGEPLLAWARWRQWLLIRLPLAPPPVTTTPALCTICLAGRRWRSWCGRASGRTQWACCCGLRWRATAWARATASARHTWARWWCGCTQARPTTRGRPTRQAGAVKAVAGPGACPWLAGWLAESRAQPHFPSGAAWLPSRPACPAQPRWPTLALPARPLLSRMRWVWTTS